MTSLHKGLFTAEITGNTEKTILISVFSAKWL